MKKLLALCSITIIVLISVGCSSQDQETFNSMYDAFERNHDEIETEFNEDFEQIESSDNRDEQLKIIYDEMIPRLEDFRMTISNFTLNTEKHTALQEDMLNYIDALQKLLELNGEFNRSFNAANPFGESDFSEEVTQMQEEIESQESGVTRQYENIIEECENISGQ